MTLMEDVVDLTPVALVNIMNMHVNVYPMFNQPPPLDQPPPQDLQHVIGMVLGVQVLVQQAILVYRHIQKPALVLPILNQPPPLVLNQPPPQAVDLASPHPR